MIFNRVRKICNDNSDDNSRSRNVWRLSNSPSRYTEMEVRNNSSYENSIGKAQRDNLYLRLDNPGPGTYEQGGTMKGPKYHFGGRHSQSTDNISPGPAQYTPNFKQRHPLTTYKFSMPGRRSSSQGIGAPGPGAYEIVAKKLKKGGKFGKDENRSLSHSASGNVPGPGTYSYESAKASSYHKASPKFT